VGGAARGAEAVGLMLMAENLASASEGSAAVDGSTASGSWPSSSLRGLRRRDTARMRACSSRALKGFTRKSSAPSSRQRIRSTSSPLAEIMITVLSEPLSRSHLRISTPSVPGRFMSRTIVSKG